MDNHNCTQSTHTNMAFYYPLLISHVYFSPLFCHAAFVCMDMYNWVCEIDTTFLKLLMLIFLASLFPKKLLKIKFLICLHLLGSKDLGFYVFRTLINIVSKQ